MKYWILSLSRDDMEHCIKVGTFGLNRKHILGRVNPGDKVSCYITKEYKIIAVGEVTQGYYVDDSKVFRRDDIFPDRIDFKAQILKKDQEVDFMTIVDQMSFIKNLAYWSVYFRAGIVEISKADWDLINKQVKAVL